MRQYCRYCAEAIDYNGEATDFICTADAPCGNNGAGRMYPASKAKRPNKCKHFEFNPMDVFYTTYGERHYKPREYKSDGRTFTVGSLEQMCDMMCDNILPRQMELIEWEQEYRTKGGE